jgi:hypothetical protein
MHELHCEGHPVGQWQCQSWFRLFFQIDSSGSHTIVVRHVSYIRSGTVFLHPWDEVHTYVYVSMQAVSQTCPVTSLLTSCAVDPAAAAGNYTLLITWITSAQRNSTVSVPLEVVSATVEAAVTAEICCCVRASCKSSTRLIATGSTCVNVQLQLQCLARQSRVTHKGARGSGYFS